MTVLGDLGRIGTGATGTGGLASDLGLQQRGRRGFSTDADIMHNDPTQVGGAVGIEHVRDGQETTYENLSPDELQRYRGLGEAAAQRGAYNVDFSKANADEQRGLYSRQAQVDAAQGLRGAAMGQAPSQAAILGNQAAGQSLEAQMQAGAGARGMGGAAAQMQAARGVGGMQLGNVGQYAGMRGSEMHQAQGAYGQAGGAMRAGDYASQAMAQQQAEAQAHSEMAQRHLNQQAQMGFEQMGINHQQAQNDADIRNLAINARRNDTNNAASDSRSARNLAIGTGAMSSVPVIGAFAASGTNGMAGSANQSADQRGDGTYSDGNTKEDIVSLYEEPGTERHYDRDVSKAKPDAISGASLSGPTPKYSSAPAKPASMGHAAAMKQHRMSDAELQRMADEMLGTQRAQHEASLADGPAVTYSDDRTKLVAAQREAFTAGLNHANTAAETGTFAPLPKYVSQGQPKTVGGMGHTAAAHAVDRPERVAPPPDRLQRTAKFLEDNVIDEHGAAFTPTFGGPGDVTLLPKAFLGADELRDAGQNFGRNVDIVAQRYGEHPDSATASLAAPVRQPVSFQRETPSDERSKQGAHPERDMGAALEQGFKPFEYEYKPGFQEAEHQQPGEKNVGPMAQNMASNSITGSAVKKAPNGLLMVDIPKATKVNSAGIGYLAAKQRELEERMNRGGR